MAVPTNTYQTFSAIGNREDLVDIIFRIDPTEVPYSSGLERVEATATNHEWQTQALSAPDTNNAALEGDDATANAATPTVRLGNYTQKSTKTVQVSGTQQAVEHAGRGDEMAYQEMLKGLELKRDIESILLTNQAKSAGTAGLTPSRTASVLSFIKSNTSKGTGGVDPAAADGTGTRTDGTQRAFNETQLKTVLQSIWNNGGKPETIMMGGFNKQVFSTFQGRATAIEETTSKKIIANVEYYASDFGQIKAVPNRFMRARDALIFQMDMWALAFLPGRKMASWDLAKTGDSDRKQMLSEYTLEARNEKSSGGIFDLTTS